MNHKNLLFEKYSIEKKGQKFYLNKYFVEMIIDVYKDYVTDEQMLKDNLQKNDIFFFFIVVKQQL